MLPCSLNPIILLFGQTKAIASPLFFYNTVYLNDKDEQLFITAMKKFGFNKQITGRNKKVFTDAIQEKKELYIILICILVLMRLL